MKHKLSPFIRNLLLVALAVQIPAPMLLAHAMQPPAPTPTMQRECPEQSKMPRECPKQPVEQSYIRIENPIFKTFVASIVDQACAQGMENHIPESILRCYEQLMAGNNELPEKDLKEALPDLLACLTAKIEQMRAPRPNAQDLSSAIVGPLVCNVNNLEDLLRELRDIIEGCCEEIQIDFDFTFSLLIDLKDPFTECCANIQDNFDGTFTVLADIKLTLTECCADIQDNFESTFSILADIKDTLTICCENIENNFESTFTVLADIKDTLTICCENIENNFEGTFTVLQEILDSLTICCADLSDSFTTTFTLLTDIFDTLTICCDNIQDNFESTFTVLADIKLTITDCCADIQDNFEGTFTFLQEILDTLTVCCTDLNNTLTSLTTASSCCPCTVLTQADFDAAVGGVIVITVPGNYTLGEDVTVTGTVGIVIAVDNVNLDLCFHKLNGGSITLDGILVFPGLINITIENGFIDPITQDGIHVLSGVTKLTIRNIDVLGAGRAGIHLEGAIGAGLIQDSIIENCRVEGSATIAASLAGLTLTNCDGVIIQGGIYNRNGSAVSITAAGILLTNCANCKIIDVLANKNTGNGCQGINITAGRRNIVDSCVTNDNIATTDTVYGVLLFGGTENTIIRSTSSNNNAINGGAHGYSFGAGETFSSIIDCITEANSTAATPQNFTTGQIGTGIFADGDNGADFNNVTRNTIMNNQTAGVYDNNTLVVIGIPPILLITVANSTTLLSQNTAIDNGPATVIIVALFSNNYLVRYGPLGAVLPVTIPFSYSAILLPVLPGLGATLLSNLDIIP